MAQIKIYLNALSDIAEEKCDGCGKTFARGERMAGVEAFDGSPMGWFCDECIDDWKANGVESRIFQES